MAHVQLECEAAREIDDKPENASVEWAAILASLVKLEAGPHKVDIDLGRLHADLQAFTSSDERRAEQCGDRGQS